MKHVGGLWFITTLCLLLAVVFCSYLLVQQKERRHKALLEQIQAAQEHARYLGERNAYLESLLSLPHCEAKAAWKIR